MCRKDSSVNAKIQSIVNLIQPSRIRLTIDWLPGCPASQGASTPTFRMSP
jgi:hypothetical protein